jgi:hypothetical protein
VVPHEVSTRAQHVVELSRAVGNEMAPGFETQTQVLQVALLHGLVNMMDRYREALHAAAADF